jgi:hypothetical protein
VLEKVQDSSNDNSQSNGSDSGSSSHHLAAHNLGLAWSLVNGTERAIEGTLTASYTSNTLHIFPAQAVRFASMHLLHKCKAYTGACNAAESPINL